MRYDTLKARTIGSGRFRDLERTFWSVTMRFHAAASD
jgi:hypothetical protein